MHSSVKVEKILVASGNQALVAPGVSLINATTGVFNIANGQLGIFANGNGNLTKDTALGPGDDRNDAPGIYIVQGTADSAAPKAATGITPLPMRAIEKSQMILSNGIYQFRGASYAAPTHSTWIVGRKDGTAGAINLASETRYAFTVGFDGRRVDLLNGRNQPAFYPEFTTEDFSDLGLVTNVTKRDYLVSNLAYSANLESRVYTGNPGGGDFICLAISETGTGAGTAISGMSAGNYTIGQDASGNDIVVAFTAAMITSLKEVITANGGPLDDTAELVNYDITTAGGGTTQADVLVFMSLDSAIAYTDRIPQVKSRLKVGPSTGFNSAVYKFEAAFAYEGEGLGKHWKLFYEATDELRKFASEQYPSGHAIQYTSPIAGTETFDAYSIYHAQPDFSSAGSKTEHPCLTIILNPVGDTTTTAALEAVLNPWMISAGSIAVNL